MSKQSRFEKNVIITLSVITNLFIIAGTMQQNPQQSLMEMDRSKIAGMKEGGLVSGIKNIKKEYAMGGGVRKVRY